METNPRSLDPLHLAMSFVRDVEGCRGQLVEALEELDRESLVFDEASDRRSEERYVFREPAPIGLIVRTEGDGTSAWPVFLRNLSRHGASFIHLREERPGARAFLSIPVSESDGVRIEGTLVRCRPVLGRFFEAGVRLATALDLERMLATGWITGRSASLVSGGAPTR